MRRINEFKLNSILLQNIFFILSNPKKGLTALHQAVLENSIELIRLLIENNADVNSFDEDSWTPLHAAVSLGYYDVTK